jgi:hypothetical protein
VALNKAAAPFEWRKTSPADAGFTPDLDLIVVVTAGNYSAPEQWPPPIRVVREVALPSLL